MKFLWRTATQEFICDNNSGWITGLKVDTPEGEKVLSFNRILLAIGSRPANRIVSTTTGIDVDSSGYVITKDRPYGMTTRKGVFAGALKFVENPDAIPTDGRHIRLLLYNTVIALMKILGIPFAIFMVLGIFASVAQTGFVYAPKKLEPNWNKLNIFAAMTQFINMKKIVESLKGIIKITVIAFIGVLVIRPYLEKVNLMPGMETMAILSFIHKIVVLLIFTVVIAVLVIAVADYAYQKYQHLKKLRMTKQEVKDEYKQMEGDKW